MRRLLVAVAFVALALVPAEPASAGAISANVADHILTVTGTDADEAVTIGCDGGEVIVNQAQPSGGPEACGDLQRILVFAEGGVDRVELGDVGPGAFDRLGSVLVDGGPGEDTLVGSGLGDELHGGGGIDTLRGGGGSDELHPDVGAGSVLGGKGHDTAFVSGSGNWSIDDEEIRRVSPDQYQIAIGSVEEIHVTGGAGDDTIAASLFSGSLELHGEKGDDKIQSGSSHDVIDGGKGNDFLLAGAGNDLIEGRAGNDVLDGDAGNDQLRGGPGDDTCSGGPGADSELSC